MTALALQIALAQLGLSPGPLDGMVGPRTWSALNAWRRRIRRPEGVAVPSSAEVEELLASVEQLQAQTPIVTPAMVKAIAPLPRGRRYAISQADTAAALTLAARLACAAGLRADDFLGQLGQESDGFKALAEYASGAAYEGREDLGNAMRGDGKRYKGRGWIQVTGRSNYAEATWFLRASGWLATAGFPATLDLEANPEHASEPTVAALTAAWYWLDRGLNPLAEAGNILAITKKINGGTNGIESRRIYVGRAAAALAA